MSAFMVPIKGTLVTAKAGLYKDRVFVIQDVCPDTKLIRCKTMQGLQQKFKYEELKRVELRKENDV